MGELKNLATGHSVEDDAAGSNFDVSHIKMGSIGSLGEIRRVGKIYAPDAPINSVVASEMARI